MPALPIGIAELPALLLCLASFFTSALSAALGLGGGVALLSLMSYALPVAALVPVHGVVQLGSNAGRMARQRRHVNWQVVIYFLVGAAIGAIAGAQIVVEIDDAWLKIALALFIIIVTWIEFPLFSRGGPALFATGGMVSTFLTMFFGATGPVTALFLAKSIDDRRQYVATHAAAMTFQHGFKILAFGLAGFAFFEFLPLMAAMIFTGYLGTLAGTKLLLAVPEKRFRQIFRWLVTLLALDIARRGLASI